VVYGGVRWYSEGMKRVCMVMRVCMVIMYGGV
jgi:hypothetical protein